MTLLTEAYVRDVNKLQTLAQELRDDRVGRAGRKTAFHFHGRKVLRATAKVLGFDEFDVRSCYGGPAVSGEVILHTPSLYLQINPDSGVKTVMYRSCEGMKDYTGGPNQWCEIFHLGSKAALERIGRTGGILPAHEARYQAEALF